MNLEIKSFYLTCIILIVCCLIYIFIKELICPKIEISKVKNELIKQSEKAKTNIEIKKARNKNYNFDLIINGKLYLVKVLFTKKDIDLQINNIDTFVSYIKTFGGSLKTSVYPGLTPFMKNKANNRIIILSKKAKTIKKVINESEMIMVDSNTNVHGINIYNFNKIDDLFLK